MNTRPFGARSGLAVGPVSLGTMRLPADREAAVALIRGAIDAGCRFIDTSRGYGESELALAEALADGYRERVLLSTKWAPWMRDEYDDDASADSVRRRIDESLRRLAVDRLDCYLIWNVNSERNYRLATAPDGMVAGIRRAMDEGLVGHAGFSSHDAPAHLLSYLDETDWAELLLVTYNLLNTNYAPVLAKARALGIGTMVMNPLGGGRLAAGNPPMQRIAAAADAADLPDLALRYVLSNPHVDTLLNGVTRPEDIRATVASAERGPLPANAVATVEAAVRGLTGGSIGLCAGCGYCLPCPVGIDIPAVMQAIQDYRYFELGERARAAYRRATRQVGGDACIRCRRCVEKCTQDLPIPEEIARAEEEFGAD